jgi:drug/metabolite transporter (DMT)-like permease
VKHYLILLAGVVGAASSVFFIKESHLAPATLSAVRLLMSAAILSPFALLHLRKIGAAPSALGLLAVLPAALALAIHYPTWFIGVRGTSAAMSTLIVNLTPVFMPFFVFALLREQINRREAIGSLIAIAGIVILVMSKDDSGQNSPVGVLTCIGSIALCTLYLALGRRFGRGKHILVYIVPLYFVAGVLSLIGAVALREPVPPITLHEVLIAMGAVIFPTVIGHTALNYAMVHLPAQVVSISSLGQFVVVAILAVPIRGEYPTWNLLLPAVLVIAGALVVIRSATPRVAEKIKLATTEPAGT